MVDETKQVPKGEVRVVSIPTDKGGIQAEKDEHATTGLYVNPGVYNLA